MMNVRACLVAMAMLGVVIGCAGPSETPPPNDGPTCRSGSCGDASFRKALPSLDALTIDFGPGRSSGALTEGVSVASLDAVSESYELTAANVEMINDVVEDAWSELEWAAGVEPESESESEIVWRSEDDADANVELLLVMVHDETGFDLTLFAGAPGVEEVAGTEIVSASIDVDSEGEPDTVTIDIHLDAIAEAWPSEGAASGDIHIEADFDVDGSDHVTYSLDEVSEDGSDPQSSDSVWSEFADGVGSLEFVYDEPTLSGRTYSIWSDDGGRMDYVANYDDEVFGALEEIGTGCWDETSAEMFDATAVFTADADFYAELDGNEDDCDFAPVDRYTGTDAFGDLPGAGEWDDIVASSCEADVDGCPPPFFEQ